MTEDLPVTVIISGRNSATTIQKCLESIAAQDYPIGEILVFDNGSTDDSRAIVESMAARASVPIRLIDGGAEGTISAAYNRGAEMAMCDVVVLCHSDCMLPTTGELRKLVTPLRETPGASVAYPRQLMPHDVWRRFPYWQKLLFVTAVDRLEHTRCATFDAVFRSTYLEVGGFNAQRFTARCGYGGEDNDAQVRFARAGRPLFTEALAIHLHSFSPKNGFLSYLRTRAMLARTYGKQLRWQKGIVERSNILFFVRPALALLPFLALFPFALGMAMFGWTLLACAIGIQCLFSILASRKMFMYRETLFDPRILLVVPVTLGMIYLEAFWFLYGLFTPLADERR